MKKIYALIYKLCLKQKKQFLFLILFINIRGGGVTTHIDENRILDDAIKQYQYKTEVYKKYNKLDFIEMANVELCNYFIGYIDIILEKYKKNISIEKIKNILNNSIFHEAYINV